MANQILRDSMGRKIGEISTDSSGKKTIRDGLGRKQGVYDPKSNTTRDALGHKVGTGDLLASLIR